MGCDYGSPEGGDPILWLPFTSHLSMFAHPLPACPGWHEHPRSVPQDRATPSPHFQPIPGVTLLNRGGLGSRDPSHIPKGSLIWGQCTGLSLDKAVLCCPRPPWLRLSCAFPRLSQLQIFIFSFAQPFLLWVPPLLGASGPQFSWRNVLVCTAAGSRSASWWGGFVVFF